MGLFWESATAQAGREFGARHYRWFAAARVLKFCAPAVAVAAVLGGLVLGYRWLSPDWPAVGARIGGWATAVGPVLFWIVAGAVALGVLAAVSVWVARNWWRLSLSRPMWMRRY